MAQEQENQGSEEVEVTVNEPGYLDMSDEDIMKAGVPEVTVTKQLDQEEKTQDELDAEKAEQDKENDQKDDQKENDELNKPDDDQSGKDDLESNKETPEKEKKPDSKESDKEVEKKEDKPTEKVVDFEKEYKRLLAPFKANGREVKVENVEDAIGLMQMGANYSKKMAALKPNLKLLKMLENSGFMSEEKISFLIDLGKNDPIAISKLVSESGIDPLDLNAEEAKKYKPTTRTVDDREIELDTALDDISDSASYTRTLNIVSNQWDAASKQEISKQPELLRVLNNHVDTGIYDLIASKVESEKMFGRLKGLSNIQAYQQVGDALHAQGAFNHLGGTQKEPEPKKQVIVEPKPKPVDEKLNDKKRAASSTKTVSSSNEFPADFNPLNLSDEEFDKVAKTRFK